MGANKSYLATGAGVLGGLLSGLFGIGGGTLIVPALVYVVGLDRRLAHGTSLAAVVPLSISSGLSYILVGEVDWVVALVLALGSVVGVWFGTRWLRVVEPRVIGVMFVVLLLFSAGRLVMGSDNQGQARSLTVVALLLLVLGGAIVGVIAGLLGIGGGALLVPMMVIGMGMPATVAKGTSLTVIIASALVGTVGNRRHLNVDIKLAAIIGVAGVVSAFAGGRLSLSLSDQAANTMFAVFLLMVATKMAVDLHQTKGASTPQESAD